MKQNEEVMEYKEELRQMIENIEDTDTIKYLRTFIKTFLKEWQSETERKKINGLITYRKIRRIQI